MRAHTPPLSSWDTTFHYTLCTFIVHLIVCFAKRSHFRLLSLLSSLLLPSYILIIATNISSIRNMTYHSSVRLTVFECSRAQQLFKNNVYVHGAHFCFSIIIIQIGSTLFVLFCPPFRPVPFCIDKFGGIFRLCANDIYIYCPIYYNVLYHNIINGYLIFARYALGASIFVTT